MPCLFVFVFVFFLPNPPQLSMGMLGMGFIATYLPDAAISAYLAAVALHIIVAQMTCIFGIMVSFHAGPISFIYVSNLNPPSPQGSHTPLAYKEKLAHTDPLVPVQRNSISYKFRVLVNCRSHLEHVQMK